MNNLELAKLHGQLSELGCEMRGLVESRETVVLAERDHPLHPWVVWFYYDEALSYGAYCATETEALEEFLRRVERLKQLTQRRAA